MSKTMLKTLRLLVPGLLLVLLGVIPVIFGPESLSARLAANEKLYACLLPFVLGAVYYILDLRRFFFAPSIEDINTRLNRSLLDPFANHPVIGPAMPRLRAGRKILNVFYNLVDNDKSLSERATHVYLNGLLLSSLADVRSVTIILLPFYLGSLLFSKQPIFWLYFFGAIALNIVCIPLVKLVTQKHIELGKEQTDYILELRRSDLERLLLEQASH
jgi:hypothetical protein